MKTGKTLQWPQFSLKGLFCLVGAVAAATSLVTAFHVEANREWQSLDRLKTFGLHYDCNRKRVCYVPLLLSSYFPDHVELGIDYNCPLPGIELNDWQQRLDDRTNQDAFRAFAKTLPKVERVSIYGRHDPRWIEIISTIPAVRGFELRNCKDVDVSQLSLLANKNELQEIIISNSSIPTESLIQQFRDNRQLVYFECDSPLLSSSGLTDLLRFSNLEGLKLCGPGITDEQARMFSEIPNLSFVDLRRTRISDRGLGLISALPKLKHLRIDGEFTFDGLASAIEATTANEIHIGAVDGPSETFEQIRRNHPTINLTVIRPDKVVDPFGSN